jgi:hypothetical protein
MTPMAIVHGTEGLSMVEWGEADSMWLDGTGWSMFSYPPTGGEPGWIKQINFKLYFLWYTKYMIKNVFRLFILLCYEMLVSYESLGNIKYTVADILIHLDVASHTQTTLSPLVNSYLQGYITYKREYNYYL